MLTSTLKIIVREAAKRAARNGDIEAVRGDRGTYGFVDERGAFRSVREPLYSAALRVLAESTDPILKGYSRGDAVCSLRAVRKIDTDMGRKLP